MDGSPQLQYKRFPAILPAEYDTSEMQALMSRILHYMNYY